MIAPLSPKPAETRALFKPDMVRAILGGIKTNTRRPVCDETQRFIDSGFALDFAADRDNSLSIFGYPGDAMLVLEGWKTRARFDSESPTDIAAAATETGYGTDDGAIPCPMLYTADNMVRTFGENDAGDFGAWGRFRSPLHLPAWGCRLRLVITDARIERLQDITEADAIAEGIERLDNGSRPGWHCYRDYTDGGGCDPFIGDGAAVRSFETLWDSIYGNWDENPHVWRYEFVPQIRRSKTWETLPENGET